MIIHEKRPELGSSITLVFDRSDVHEHLPTGILRSWYRLLAYNILSCLAYTIAFAKMH